MPVESIKTDVEKQYSDLIHVLSRACFDYKHPKLRVCAYKVVIAKLKVLLIKNERNESIMKMAAEIIEEQKKKIEILEKIINKKY